MDEKDRLALVGKLFVYALFVAGIYNGIRIFFLMLD